MLRLMLESLLKSQMHLVSSDANKHTLSALIQTSIDIFPLNKFIIVVMIPFGVLYLKRSAIIVCEIQLYLFISTKF